MTAMTKETLMTADFLSLVPAGGMGTRLGVLTAERAKPALAISFDNDGNVQRMIDVPLAAIRGIGGAALVTTRFAAETLDFVDDYPHAQTMCEYSAGSPIDSLVSVLPFVEASTASMFGIIPGDAYVSADTLSGMRCALEASDADATILATRHLEGHNVRHVDRRGVMTNSERSADRLADLGVHIMRRAWLLGQLQRLADEGRRCDIWDIYGVDAPTADVLLHVPKIDPVAVDMGTGTLFHGIVSRINAMHADKNGNIVFPGARIDPHSTDTIALPQSLVHVPCAHAVVPEGVAVYSAKQVYFA
jgi:hypothetical protein